MESTPPQDREPVHEGPPHPPTRSTWIHYGLLHYPQAEAHYSGLRLIDPIDCLDASYRSCGYISRRQRRRAACLFADSAANPRQARRRRRPRARETLKNRAGHPCGHAASSGLQQAGNLLEDLVGAGRFERPTPCAQGRCATRLRYAPTCTARFILNYLSVRHPFRNSIFSPNCDITVPKPYLTEPELCQNPCAPR
jgi:hypothetical protein